MSDAIRKIQAYVEFVKSIPEDQWPDQGMDADEELAWMYGREPDQTGVDRSAAWSGPMVTEVNGEHQVRLWHRAGTPFEVQLTTDEAVDLARALLAAAEKASGHK